MKKIRLCNSIKRLFAGLLAAFLMLSVISLSRVRVDAMMIYSSAITLTNLQAGVAKESIGASCADGTVTITSIKVGGVETGKLSCTGSMVISFTLSAGGMVDPMFTVTIQPQGYSDIDIAAEDLTNDGTNVSGSFTLAALPHNYTSSAITTAATCTADGVRTYTCAGCGGTKTEAVTKLGHNYTSAITKEATCGEAGVKTFTCANCNDTYTEAIAATGNHTYPASWIVEKKATATATGLQYKLCTVCNHRIEETLPTLSAEVTEKEETETTKEENAKEASTTTETEAEDESAEETAEESSDETSEAAETEVSEEETDKMTEDPSEETAEETSTEEAPPAENGDTNNGTGAGETKPGLIEKIRTGLAAAKRAAREHQAGAILLGAGAAGLIAGAGVLVKTKTAASVAAKAGKAAKAAKAGEFAAGLPELSGKIVLTYLEENEFNTAFSGLIKEKPFLTLVAVDKPAEDLPSQAHDEAPHLIILEITDAESLKQAEQDMINIRAVYSDAEFSVLAATDFLSDPENEAKLKAMEASGTIKKYTDAKALVTPAAAFSHLILPIYRPELTPESTVSYIGDIADLLGIPGISFITRLYTDGKDIKEIAELHDQGIVEKSAIIADIADILGLSQVASVLGLIDDLDTVKGALEKGSGTQDGLDGASAVKDIVDVVSDIIS